MQWFFNAILHQSKIIMWFFFFAYLFFCRRPLPEDSDTEYRDPLYILFFQPNLPNSFQSGRYPVHSLLGKQQRGVFSYTWLFFQLQPATDLDPGTFCTDV